MLLSQALLGIIFVPRITCNYHNILFKNVFLFKMHTERKLCHQNISELRLFFPAVI